MMNINYNKNNINLYINYLLVGYVFCLPISKAGTNFFEILIILLWLFQGDWKNKYNQYKSNPLIVTFVIFILYSLVSVFWANSISVWLDYIAKYRHFLLIPILYTLFDIKYLNYVFTAFLSSIFISEIMSYGIFFEFWTYKDVSPSDPSPFMDHISYSVYLAFTSMILLNKIFFESDIKYKVIYIFFFTTVTANLFINGGRTGQVIFVVTLISLFIFNSKNRIKSLFSSILLLSIIFISAYNMSPNYKNRFNYTVGEINLMITENNFEGGFSQRVSLWIVGIDKFKDNYLFGTGIGNEMVDIDIYSSKYNIKTIDMTEFGDHHNMFLTYAIQLGIPGLIIILFIFYNIIILKFNKKEYRNLNIIFIISFFLWSLTGMTFHGMNPMTFFALFTGLFTSLANINTKDNYGT